MRSKSRTLNILATTASHLLARLFKPQGAGPFPPIVEVHGGAWCLMDRTHDAPVNEPLARSGVIVVALDFRMPPTAPYPASMADINYGIRWAKRHVREFGGRPDWVGVMGSSSGGHQAMLAAMRPDDARYSSIALQTEGPQVDATVNCVVMLWPVIDPLGRYQYAKELKAAGKPYPELVDLVLPLHDKYWKDEAEMAEGNPTRALERGERADAAAHPSTCRARLTWRIRGPIWSASSRPIARRAGSSISNCSTTSPRVSSCATPRRRLQPRPSRKSSTFVHRQAH